MDVSLINPNLIHIDLSNVIKMENEGYFYLNLSLSNDNVTFSEPITLTAYNSSLYKCYENLTCVKTISNNSFKMQPSFGIILFFLLNILFFKFNF